jgi:hypothetical protein
MYALFLSLLIPSAPSLSDLDHFPRPEETTAALSLSDHYQHYLEMQRELFAWHTVSLDMAIDEAWTCRRAWEALDEAWTHPTLDGRRESLGRLKSLLGARRYALGEMPPAIPWGRVAERD